MSETTDLESLVRAVTDLVVARLGGGAARHGLQASGYRLQAPGRPDEATPVRAGNARGDVFVLLPVAPARPEDLARRLEELGRLGWRVRGSAAPEARAAMEHAGLSSHVALAPLDPGHRDPADPPGRPARHEVVVLGSLGFAFARRLAALDDDDPFVRRIARALLDGRKVLALGDDLAPAPAAAGGTAAHEAADVLQRLERLGLEVHRTAELEGVLARLTDAGATVARAAGGLLTEAEVVRLREAGETRLVLAPHTIVTPLARSKAAELGLTLEEGG
ncbi:MAG: hypothetical protein HY905_09735 [Deltaproteobacteria bacterium]|nr:hypothetical protein [Deltaproteobacteria bacterium]